MLMHLSGYLNEEVKKPPVSPTPRRLVAGKVHLEDTIPVSVLEKCLQRVQFFCLWCVAIYVSKGSGFLPVLASWAILKKWSGNDCRLGALLRSVRITLLKSLKVGNK